MLTLVNFVAALIASWVVVYAIYGLALLGVHSVWWTVRVVSWFIVYARLGVTFLVVRPVWWMVLVLARLGEGARIRSSHADGTAAPAVTGTHAVPQTRALIAEVGPAAAGTAEQAARAG